MSSSRKIALLDVQQNFYWMPSRTCTRRLVDQMICAIVGIRMGKKVQCNFYVISQSVEPMLKDEAKMHKI